MFDFAVDIADETQVRHFFYFLIFYLLAFVMNSKAVSCSIKTGVKWSSISFVVLLISLIILTIAAYTRGDFYHYADYVKNGYGEEHMEDFYLWLTLFVNRNYFLWRLFVWGSALLLFFITVRRLRINIKYSAFVLLFCFILIFNYARVSLACALYYFGFSFLIKPIRVKFLSYIVGVLIVWCSHYFHNSINVLIILTPIVLLPLNKYTIFVIVAAVIASAGATYALLLNNIYSFEGSQEYADIFMMYAETNKSILSGGLSGFISLILEYGSIILPIYVLTKRIIFSNQEHDGIPKYLYKMIFSILLVSIAMGTSSGTAYFFYRLLFMSIIPITLLLVYCYEKEIVSYKDFKLCVYWGFINVLYINLYGIYTGLIG